MRPRPTTGELNARRGSLVPRRAVHAHPPLVTVRALLVGGYVIFRKGLRELLERAGFHVVGEAASCEAALELLQDLAPDLIVVDVDLPAGCEIGQLRELVDRRPGARVVVLTASAGEASVAEAVLAGARGYLLKNASPGELVLEIETAVAGDALVLPREVVHMVKRFASERAEPQAHSLSDRELEVLRLLVDGRDNGQIAKALVISPSTAKTHVAHILKKLRSENRIQAAVYATRWGLV
jgi:DNA-binding NarL/FixJ family response regulator